MSLRTCIALSLGFDIIYLAIPSEIWEVIVCGGWLFAVLCLGSLVEYSTGVIFEYTILKDTMLSLWLGCCIGH